MYNICYLVSCFLKKIPKLVVHYTSSIKLELAHSQITQYRMIVSFSLLDCLIHIENGELYNSIVTWVSKVITQCSNLVLFELNFQSPINRAVATFLVSLTARFPIVLNVSHTDILHLPKNTGTLLTIELTTKLFLSSIFKQRFFHEIEENTVIFFSSFSVKKSFP